jgi:hypothetical protein
MSTGVKATAGNRIRVAAGPNTLTARRRAVQPSASIAA